MFQKILVPLDGSKLAERALEPALRLAQAASGELLLLSIPFAKHLFVEDPIGYKVISPETSIEATRAELSAYLHRLTETRAPSDAVMYSRIGYGDEASVIVDTAVAEAIDLIVMSTHGFNGMSRWFLGSVTEKVLRSAPCPVLVIRDDKPFSHVLITLDGSPLSERALMPGFALAHAYDAHLTLLRVKQEEAITPSLIRELETQESGLGSHVQEAIHHRAEHYLEQLAEAHRHLSRKKVQSIAVTGPVAAEILATIEDEAVDLVVMSTHGRTGLRRWVYGSITEKVMRHAGCSMLIIRPPAEALQG
ncbi:MAG: universal stress protein [Chloroflexota bacterium]